MAHAEARSLRLRIENDGTQLLVVSHQNEAFAPVDDGDETFRLPCLRGFVDEDARPRERADAWVARHHAGATHHFCVLENGLFRHRHQLGVLCAVAWGQLTLLLCVNIAASNTPDTACSDGRVRPGCLPPAEPCCGDRTSPPAKTPSHGARDNAHHVQSHLVDHECQVVRGDVTRSAHEHALVVAANQVEDNGRTGHYDSHVPSRLRVFPVPGGPWISVNSF